MNPDGNNDADQQLDPDDPQSFKDFLVNKANEEIRAHAKAMLNVTIFQLVIVALVVVGLHYFSPFDALSKTVVIVVVVFCAILLVMCWVTIYQAYTNFVTAKLVHQSFKLLPDDVAQNSIGDNRMVAINRLYAPYANRFDFHKRAAALIGQLLTMKQPSE